MVRIQSVRKDTLDFLGRCCLGDQGTGRYRYSLSATAPTLYSSTYAVMTMSLYDSLKGLTDVCRQMWVDYFDRHQDDDGLFRDPVIFDQGWYEGDPFWCGRPHLTCHVLTALRCLGSTAKKPIQLVRRFYDKNVLIGWLEQRNWCTGIGLTGNEIMNLGTLLQYSREFHNDHRAGHSMECLFDWMDTHYVNPTTGVWGTLDISNPLNRSHAVQAAYHWWALYFYDRREIPHTERAIDTLLSTQNANGGFGCGVHNPQSPLNSSACEDIDSIDPLVRMSFLTDYRHEDIVSVLQKAAEWVVNNQADDGGFVFMRDRPFEYGHSQMYSPANTGAMFPTWFRTLSLAILAKALPESNVGRYKWQFTDCPGFQFWKETSRSCQQGDNDGTD